MLETISRAISTALFFLCTAIVTGLSPTAPAATVPPSETVAYEEFSIVGTWDSGGKTLEFTPAGKLTCDGVKLRYTVNGDTLTVRGTVNGEAREYSLKIEQVSDRVVKLGGVTMYRIK